MATGAYGRRLGKSVGVEAPPTTRTQVLKKAEFAATRVTWGQRKHGTDARIEREDASLVCLHRHDMPSHPYWVGGRAVPMSPVKGGQFTLVDLSSDHASHLRDPIDCVAMYVSRGALDQLADEHGAPRIETLHVPPGVPVDDPVVWHLGECLLPALERPDQANRLFIGHVAMALLAHVARSYGDMAVELQPKRGGLAPWQERRAKEALMAHIDGDIGLEELAELCRLSRSHFARAFTATTGAPPHRWLLARRVERAQDLLLSSALSLAQIANSCGFADQSHFSRVFVAFTGATPGQWRRCRRS